MMLVRFPCQDAFGEFKPLRNFKTSKSNARIYTQYQEHEQFTPNTKNMNNTT